VRFRITRHSGVASPADALELLLARVGAKRSEVAFAMVGAEIRATWGDDEGDSSTREARAEVGREAVLEVVVDVCSASPELQSDWFAISPMS